MKPINNKERNNAFLRFLLLFSITICLIVLVIFFGTNVPLSENKQLRSQLKQYEQQEALRKNVQNKIENILSLLDTVNKAGINTDIIDGRITQHINETDAIVSKDTSASQEMYHLIVKSMNDMQFDKRAIRSSAKMDDRLAEKDKIIEQLTKNRDSWKDRADQLQQQIIMMQR